MNQRGPLHEHRAAYPSSENKAEWLLSKCEELERNGFLYRVDTSEWALNAMAALKPNGRDFRMVINLIPTECSHHSSELSPCDSGRS
jgi:hypothetical protein